MNNTDKGVAILDYYKVFTRNNILLISSYLIIYARSIILLPLFIKNIGATVYGGYVLLIISLGFISGIATLGTGFKFRRFIPSVADPAGKRNLFYPPFILQIISVLFISGILLISSDFIKRVVFKGSVDFSILIFVLLLIVYVPFNLIAEYFRYTHKMVIHSVAITVEPLLLVLFMVISIIIFKARSLNYLLSVHILVMSVISSFLLYKIIREIGIFPFHINLRSIFDDICLGLPLVLSNSLDFILSGSDRYVIGFIISSAAVAYYNTAYTLGSLIILIPKVCGAGVLLPLISRAHDNENKVEMKNMVDYTIKLFLIAAIPFVFGSLILSRRLLELFANSEVANAAYSVTPVVALGILFYGLSLFYSQILLVKLKIKAIFSLNIFSAGLNLVLNIVLIHIYKSILVAALTTLVSYFISFLILHSLVKKYILISYDYALIRKCLFSALAMSFLIYFMQIRITNNLINIVIIILVSVLFYFLLLLLFKAFSKKEIKFVRDLFFPIKAV